MTEFFNAIWPYISLPLLAISLYVLYKVVRKLVVDAWHEWEGDYDE